MLPTRTIYEFTGAGVKVGLTFFTPALPDDLDVLSRPLTYIEWSIASADGKEHEAAVYFDAGPDMVVNVPEEAVEAARCPDRWPDGASAWGRRSSPFWESAATICASTGATSISRPIAGWVSRSAIGSRQRVRGDFEPTGALPVFGRPPGRLAAPRGGPTVLALLSELRQGRRGEPFRVT